MDADWWKGEPQITQMAQIGCPALTCRVGIGPGGTRSLRSGQARCRSNEKDDGLGRRPAPAPRETADGDGRRGLLG